MGMTDIHFCFLILLLIFRALEIVRDLNSSESRKSKFTEMALQKILDSHLSAKYSYLGRLGSIDYLLNKLLKLNFFY
jgi:hypothetical protein